MPSHKLSLTDPSDASAPDFIEKVRSALELPIDANLELQNVERGAMGGASVEYAATLPVELHGKEFGVADGVTVDEQISISLQFDANGNLVDSQTGAIDERHLRLVKDNVRKLAAADQIYLAKPDETIDTDMLRTKHKPWYIETGTRAKRLKRAYIS